LNEDDGDDDEEEYGPAPRKVPIFSANKDPDDAPHIQPHNESNAPPDHQVTAQENGNDGPNDGNEWRHDDGRIGDLLVDRVDWRKEF
jgi:hypothetical protein